MGSPQAWQHTPSGTDLPSALASSFDMGREPVGGRGPSKGTDAQRYKQLQEVLRYMA